MKRIVIAAAGLLGMANAAQAGPVVFMGGLHVYSTSGCVGWDPVRMFQLATFQVPVAGSTNGTDSTITIFMGNNSNAFQLRNGVFTSTFKWVEATGINGRAWTYSAMVKVTAKTPATITTATTSAEIVGSIKGGYGNPECVTNFRLNGVRLP